MAAVFRWWFIACLTAAGLVVAGVFGAYQYIWAVDATKLSFVTLAVFAFATVFIGLLTWRARDGDQGFARHLAAAWFTSEFLMGLGMLGTLFGFLLLLQAAFGGQLDLSSAAAAQKVLASMATGFATAGVTTLVGLACSLLLKAQLINLEYQLDG
jgi:hypothetical protein